MEDEPSLRQLASAALRGYGYNVLEAGVALLQKPFATSQLARRVREILDAPPGARPEWSLSVRDELVVIFRRECVKVRLEFDVGIVFGCPVRYQEDKRGNRGIPSL